jgi:hypothetical protein
MITFLPLYQEMKIAFCACLVFLAETPLPLSVAHCVRNNPAGPSRRFPLVDAVQPRFHGAGTDTFFRAVGPSEFAAALFILPAIHFLHDRTSFAWVIRLSGLCSVARRMYAHTTLLAPERKYAEGVRFFNRKVQYGASFGRRERLIRKK